MGSCTGLTNTQDDIQQPPGFRVMLAHSLGGCLRACLCVCVCVCVCVKKAD